MKLNPAGGYPPTHGIWNRFLLLVPLVLVLAIGSWLYIRPRLDTFTAYGNVYYDEAELAKQKVTLSDPHVVEVLSIERSDLGTALVTFHALSDGACEATLSAPEHNAETRDQVFRLQVRNGAITEGVNFSGWEAVEFSLCVLLAALVVLFASVVARLLRTSWYGYTMVASVGGLLFCLFQLVFLVGAIMSGGGNPSFVYFLFDVVSMADYLFALSLFFMVPMAVLVSISNIALIRHEGFRLVNLLGIIASVTWMVAYLWFVLADSLPGEARHFQPFISVACAYGECLLLSVIVCAWLAAKHVPKRKMDYLIILGCGIRDDGTPCPLLAGRVDKAAAFDQERIAVGDAPATFVPSGGKGDDEIISEAQSMANYLEEQWGVDRNRIVLEDRSVRTSENMSFSREVIERHAGRDANELDVAFSTTNYHVFRGYVCAHQAGMAVEGMGSKTRYYFWPNAFLREFIGLLVVRWKAILQLYLIIGLVYTVANYLVQHA